MATKKAAAKKTKTAWSRKDVRGPADTAGHVALAKVVNLKINEFGFRPRRPMLGGVPEGPIHVRRLTARPLPGGAPGGAPCPVNVTKSSGGNIIASPKVVLMWWSTYFWDRHKTERNYYKAALNAFANDSAFWSRLSEYGITGGSYGGSVDLTRFGGPSASVSESAIQAALTFRFDNLATPPDSSTIYVVMLPNGISSAYDTSNGFIGHHQTYKYKSTDIYYSVVEYSADKNRTLWVLTHEVYEAATDPDVSTGYYDHSQGGETEVGDLCNGQTTIVDGYTVQQVWSQKGCDCV